MIDEFMPIIVVLCSLIMGAFIGAAICIDAKTEKLKDDCRKQNNVCQCEVIAVPLKN